MSVSLAAPPASGLPQTRASSGRVLARREHETRGVGLGIKQINPRGDNATCGRNRMGLGAETLSDGQKVPAYSGPRRNGGKGVHLTSPRENADGVKIGCYWFSDPSSRKAASAQIAKIPFELSRHIAAVYYPRTLAQGGRLTAAGGKS
jgi:hypothetical protein